MRYICSVLTVSDIQYSRKFYEAVLNQKVKFDFGENVMFHGGFSIHLRPHFKKLIDNREVTNWGINGISVLQTEKGRYSYRENIRNNKYANRFCERINRRI